MPWGVTRIVPNELEAVFTVAVEELVVAPAGCELVELVELDELLPHAASTNDVPRSSGNSLIAFRIASLPI